MILRVAEFQADSLVQPEIVGIDALLCIFALETGVYV
jgi:hypothetical protein